MQAAVARATTAARAIVSTSDVANRRTSSSFAGARPSGVQLLAEIHPRDILAVGAVSFVVRAHVNGSPRFASEAELVATPDARVGGEGSIRGAFAIAGPPAHTLLDLFVSDVAVAAGELWRAMTHVPEPGTAMDIVIEAEKLVISLEHGDRALVVKASTLDGALQARASYDPFAFIDGVVAACERLDRFLRARGLNDASQTMYRHFARPSFPRCVGVDA